MPITYNGVTIPTNADVIKYNGNDVDIVTYNGVTIWEKIKAYITFNKNAEAATGSMAQQAGGTGVVLNKNTFARTNCNFLGWNTASDATSALYADGATADISQDTTLYAVWALNGSVSLGYDFNVGDNCTGVENKGTGYIGKIYLVRGSSYVTVYTQFFDSRAASNIILTTSFSGSAQYIFEDNDGNSFTVSRNARTTLPTKFRNKNIRLKLRFTGIANGDTLISVQNSFRITLS